MTHTDFPCDFCGDAKECVKVERGPVIRYVCRTCAGVIGLMWSQERTQELADLLVAGLTPKEREVLERLRGARGAGGPKGGA